MEIKSIARFATAAAAILVLGPSSRADFITGTVVDSNGVGVAGVDIDVKNLRGGGDPPIFNDGTNANGFFLTTVPDGTYLVTFTPPPPPATTHLITEQEPIIVVGTKNMGTITLGAGVSLSGRLLDAAMMPVAGVNLDVIDLSTGENINLMGDVSDAFGQFNVAAPLGDVELRFDTTPVVLQTLAPDQLDLTLSADQDLGDVPLDPGFLVTATLRGPGGSPVVNADVDVRDSATGEKLYTPGDNTSSIGFVDFVVPAGTFDVVFCPQFANRLVAKTLPSQVVTGTTPLGVVSVQSGVVLSGNVRDLGMTPVGNVDLDVKITSSGSDVTLCGDDTNGMGNYSVVVPNGTLTVAFSPPFSQPLAETTSTGVFVIGDTVLDAVLPSCPFHTTSGSGLPGTGGFVPLIGSTGGTPRLGNPAYAITVDQGIGGGTVLLGVRPRPPLPQIMVPRNRWRQWNQDIYYLSRFSLSGPAGVAGVGSGEYAHPIPNDPALSGVMIDAIAIVLDPGASSGKAISEVLHATVCN